MIYKVGLYYPVGRKNKQFSYRDVHAEDDGWVDVNRFLPADFDLCWLRLHDDKVMPGWHTGHYWDALNYKSHYIITAWKRKEEEER